MYLEYIALQVLKLNSISPVEARMAYSALLLIPWYESLKFMPFLKQCKQQWNTSTPKYAGFLVCRNCDAEIGGRTIELEQHQKGKGQIRSVFSTATAHPEDLFAPMLESPRPGGYFFHQNQKEMTSPGDVGAIAASGCLTLH